MGRLDGAGAAVRRLLASALLLGVLLPAPSRAHVGSPNVFFDGEAGPYPVRVIVRPPEVIPGLAEVTVRVKEGTAQQVTAQPIDWKAGAKGAPPPDAALPVPGGEGLWSASLWLMEASSYSVEVRVSGEAGEGRVLVPVAALPTRILTMERGMGWLLAGLGLFLFFGAVTLVGAAVRESTLPPGEAPDPRRLNLARTVAALAGILLALILFAGKRWWDSVDARARAGIYKPFNLETAARAEGGRAVLRLAIDDPDRKDWSPLMPDHGKLMHAFLIREPALDAFAHIHPVPAGEDAFEVTLPPLPAGTYRIYADIVHESGFPQTLVDTVEVPAVAGDAPAPGAPVPDPDDSWRHGPPVTGLLSAGPKLSILDEEGTQMLWHQAPLEAGRETDLRFEVRSKDGHPIPLEPYMGMLSHAAITKDDGKVFVHLHPMGSINMAAQQAFETKIVPEATPAPAGMAGMDHSAHAGHVGHGPSVVSFPYELPEPGRYRIWVQVKSGGKVLTGVFDTEVGGVGK
ncbi:MAG TPA: hypothetical protein VLT87_03045 [Thermoanaerobaculia bacterium]|nr:hypothetical protein [Thermoanaerobaculia bacterium]